MAIRVLSSMWRWIAWCFLVSACIASAEAVGYSLTHGSEDALALGEFALRFSNSCWVLLTAISATWLCVWFFMVWLGGVRPGIALLFTLLFFALRGFLGVSLDLLFALTSQFAAYRSLLVMDSVVFAAVSAGLISLIVAKISRRFRPANRSPRGAAILSVLLAVCVVAVLAPALLAAAARPAPQPRDVAPASPHAVKHVFLITIDTLRQDALGCYNGGASNTPRIDEFARDAAVFANAFSAAPWTYPAVTSILTGLAPRVHQVVDVKTKLPENVPTLAEQMQGAGYRTAALGYNSLLLPRTKLDRGFQEYDWFPTYGLKVDNFEMGLTRELLAMAAAHKPSTAQLTDRAIQWVKNNAEQDGFFWLHYFDPHIPYMPPTEFLPTDPRQRAMGSLFWDVKLARGGSVARSAEERAWIRALYDGEVRYVDAQVGRLLDALKELGIYDDALIVLTSDHGEEFWDHGHFEHGHTLFNELIRVPLLVKLPANREGKTVDAFVTTQAVTPTILDVCGVAPNAAGALPPPLSPLLGDMPEPVAAQPLFSGSTLFQDPAESVVFDGMKYIRTTLSGRELLFNLKEDPKELDSVAVQDPESLARGRQLLDAELAAAPALAEKLGIHTVAGDQLDPRDILNLQNLGYL